MSPHEPATPTRKLPLWGLMIALIIWTTVLAAGSFLYGYREDFRKPLIVIGTMSLFLFVWLALLWFKSRRAS